jgi:hypothetical protein
MSFIIRFLLEAFATSVVLATIATFAITVINTRRSHRT